MEIVNEIIKLIIVLTIIFAPYVLINAVAALISAVIRVTYPAYQAAQNANEKAKKEIENIK